MLAKDVMTTEVAAVSPDTSVSEIAQLLLERRISAAPVVDEKNNIVGIVSEGDLMHRPETDTENPPRSWWLGLMIGTHGLAEEFSKSHGKRASDVMTKDVIVVDEEVPVGEIAQLLEENHIKRVPVVRDGTLIGIVSRANLLRGLATAKQAPLSGLSKNDQTIQQDVLAALRKEPWANLSLVNATVEDGVVHLWGLSESTEQRNSYELAAAGVEGVQSIQNHLSHSMSEFYWAE